MKCPCSTKPGVLDAISNPPTKTTWADLPQEIVDRILLYCFEGFSLIVGKESLIEQTLDVRILQSKTTALHRLVRNRTR